MTHSILLPLAQRLKACWFASMVLVVLAVQGQTAWASCGDYLFPLGSGSTSEHESMASAHQTYDWGRSIRSSAPCHGPGCSQAPENTHESWAISTDSSRSINPVLMHCQEQTAADEQPPRIERASLASAGEPISFSLGLFRPPRAV